MFQCLEGLNLVFLLRINWRPLCAIAQVLSGDWPARVLQSFNLFTASRGDDAKSLGVMLLEDIGGKRLLPHRLRRGVQAIFGLKKEPLFS